MRSPIPRAWMTWRSLRGSKRDIWEGAHRVPFIVRWPGVVPAGKVNEGLTSQIILFAPRSPPSSAATSPRQVRYTQREYHPTMKPLTSLLPTFVSALVIALLRSLVRSSSGIGWMLAVSLCLTPHSFIAAPPNILFIFSDDHAQHAISAYGSKVNQTPHIDRLAEGRRAVHEFASSPIPSARPAAPRCSPGSIRTSTACRSSTASTARATTSPSTCKPAATTPA